MKVLTVVIFFLTLRLAIAQDTDADLNGKVFSGTATEIIQQDADKLPLTIHDIIRFENGNIFINLHGRYPSVNLPYTSEIDHRRMIAAKVVVFDSNNSGMIDSKEVRLEFSGEVIGDKNLSGIFTVMNSDGTQLKFSVIAKTE